MKIGVVEFCTMPLVVTSQKTTWFAPFGYYENEKTIFYVASGKSLVIKVVGLELFTSIRKIGSRFKSLLWNLHKPWSNG
jgi:hypothetical protein